MAVNKARRLGSYAPLSAHYYKDDAIAQAGEAAELLYVRGLAFCADVLSDGFISDVQVTRFVGVGMKSLQPRIQRLLDAGLWSRVDGGYWVNAWLKWNRSNEEITRLQQKDAARKVKPGSSPDDGANGEGTDSERNPNGIQPDSEPSSDVESERNPSPRARSTSLHATSLHATPAPRHSTPGHDSTANEEFDRFWSAYPRKVDKAKAKDKWKQACKKLNPEELISEAQRWAGIWEKAGTEQQFIPHPTTWLNGERWNDEPPAAKANGHQPFRNPSIEEFYQPL